MSDETRFYNMTKPVKFRTMKMISQSVRTTYEVGTKRVNYLINYILYKLNILKRFTNKDTVNRQLIIPHNYDKEVVATPLVMAHVIPQIFEERTIDIDYFRTKDGRKITHVVSDESESRLFLECKLADIQLCVAGKWYSVNHLPKFKASINDGEEFNTQTFDVMRLKKMRTKHFLGVCDLEHISRSQFNYFYKDIACKSFKAMLSTLELKDLIMEVSNHETKES